MREKLGEKLFSKMVSKRSFLKKAGAAAGVVGAYSVGAPFVHAQKRNVTLRFLNQETDPGTIKMLNQSFEEYKSKTGVTVIMDSVPSTDAFIKLSTSIRAGQPYDIGNLLYIGDILLLAESGNLVPMTPLIDEIGRKDFGPKVLFPSKGEIWDYPYDYNFATLYYRTDWLEKNKIGIPNTWDEVVKASRSFMVNKDGRPEHYGAVFPIASGGATNWLSFAWLWAENIKLLGNDWSVMIDSPETKPKMIKFLQFFRELYGTMPPSVPQAAYAEMLSLFATEKVGISTYSGRLIHHLERFAPTLADKYVLGAYPDMNGQNKAINHGADSWMVVKTKNSDESMKFISWFVKEKLIDFYSTIILHYQPTRFSIYEDPRWFNHPLVKKHSKAVEFTKSLLTRTDIRIDAIDQQGPKVDVRGGKLFESFVMPEMLQSLVLRKTDPIACVEEAAAKMRKTIQKDT
jgi:multiple sugar transport system substrate-binding protein